MSAIPPASDSTVSRIFFKWESRHTPRFSRRLGASQIGKPCERMLWYLFRWAKPERFEGRILRLFQKGHVEEACVCNELSGIGVDVQAVDPDTGEQWEFSELGDHFVCKLDFAACGFPEAPGTWHVGEIKTANEKAFNAVQKDGCQKAQPAHHSQVMTGMGMSGMERGAYLVVNKNTDDIYFERIPFDKKEWLRILQRAKEIIFATEAPDRINESPAWYQCAYCTFKNICHDCGEVAIKNCRTCRHSTALEEGGWACDKHGKIIDMGDQLNGCADHVHRDGMVGESVHKAMREFDGKIDTENLSV